MDEIDKINKEVEESMARFRKTEENGVEKILYYFDRIHSNLFNYNNLLIAGFFTLIQLDIDISKYTILVPIVNLWILVLIEYRLMEKSRFESKITNQSQEKIAKYGNTIQNTNLYSLLSIILTMATTLFFLYCLLMV